MQPKPHSASPSRSAAMHWHDWLGRSVFAMLLAVAVFLLFLSRSQNENLTQARTGLVQGFAPVVSFISQPAQMLSQITTNLEQGWANYQHANELAAENKALRQWHYQAQQLQQENAALRRLLQAGGTVNAGELSAPFYARSSGPYHHYYQIGIGEAEGARAQMAVKGEHGLVGRIRSSGAHLADIISITDINSRIAVLAAQSGERGIVKGRGDALLELDFLPEDTKISTGELLYTSGDGALMPANIPVGHVVSVEEDSILVKPLTDWQRLQHVRVVAVEGE